MKVCEIMEELRDAGTPWPRMVCLARGLADVLRIKAGLSYNQTQRYVEEWTGMDARDWEALLYAADMEECDR